MKKSQQSSSFLSNQLSENSSDLIIQKQQSQFKALFMKNILLQSKQKCTNICQILTPIICLIFTYLMKTIAQENIKIVQPYDDNFYPYKFNDFADFDQINKNVSRVQLQYFMYECGEKCDRDILGININKTREGMLGEIPQTATNITFYPNAYQQSKVIQSQNAPFFLQATPSINKQLFDRLSTIGLSDYSILRKGGLDYLPDGSINFIELNNDSMITQLKINDVRDLQLHRNNGLTRSTQQKINTFENRRANVSQFVPPYGLLHLMHITMASYIKTITEGAIIQAGYIFMPTVEQGSVVDSIINTVSALIFPLGLSLLFPVFLYSIVLEKEQRLVQMMKMNGLKIRYYWLTFFLFNLTLSIVTNLLFFLVGTFVFTTQFFSKTSPALLFVVSFGWSLAQIGMAAFFQTFLNKSRSANIIGYLVSIWTTMIGATLNIGVYQYPSVFPIGLQMFPPFAFVRLFYLMMMQCTNGDCVYQIGNITEQMRNCILFLYLGFLFFFILGAYLFQIIPQQFGVTRSPLFPINSFLNLFKKKQIFQIDTSQDPQLRDYISQHEQDNFSKSQRQKVINFNQSQNQQQIKSKYPLIINNMRKLYKKQGVQGMYAAVRSFNLALSKNQTFGLLGPNGAGKTTLISMITGMYQPNNGNAWIGGYDIRNNISKAQLQMGVCPQFDLVWPQMSVSEHLYFYARLKGIPEKKIKERVQSSIREVKLQNFANFAANQLSGGMKRRLSVAISLVGDPKIVFLDQPSTGLDPQNRRQLWAVLAECQTKRALFITTHMMQQADTLCNRIGIITNGVLRTIQTPIKLKKVYGQGYDVIINTVKEQRQLISRQSLHLGIEQEQWYNQQQKVRASIGSFIQNQQTKSLQLNQMNRKIVQFMKNQFTGTFLFKHFNGYLIFKVPTTFKISNLFETMKKVQKQLEFSDIAISNSSLQDVFMSVVAKFDSDGKEFFPNGQEQLLKEQQQLQKASRSPKQSIKSNKKSNKGQKKEQDLYESVISKSRQSVISEHSAPQNINESSKKSSSSKQQEYVASPKIKGSKMEEALKRSANKSNKSNNSNKMRKEQNQDDSSEDQGGKRSKGSKKSQESEYF